MAVTEGYKTSIKVSAATDSGYSALGLCTSVTLNESRETLDTTALVTSSAGAQTVIAGLKKGSVTFNCDYDPADAGQVIINTGYGAGSSVWAQVKWDDSAGDNVECKVISKQKGSAPNGKVTIAYTLTATGAVDQTMH